MLRVAYPPRTFLFPPSAIRARPDLYGAVWISTTLIFFIAVFSNVASYFAFEPTVQGQQWKYDVNMVTAAAFVVYGYAVTLPLVLLGVFIYFGVKTVRFSSLLCLYAYALAPFAPVAVS